MFAEPVAPIISVSYGGEIDLRDFKEKNVTIGGDISLLAGSPLVINCPARGVPQPRVNWLKDSKPLLGDELKDTNCNGTFRILSVKASDSGEYLCYVNNYLGLDMAFTRVNVIGKLKTTSIDRNNLSSPERNTRLGMVTLHPYFVC